MIQAVLENTEVSSKLKKETVIQDLFLVSVLVN